MNVFGLFARKPLQPPETVPPPSSPSASTSHQSPTSKPSTTKNAQLRTPSPSVESGSAVNATVRSASPSTKIARLSLDERNASPTRRGSFGGATLTAVVPPQPFSPPEPTVSSLVAHLTLIPPKTLHAYVLARVPSTAEDHLPALAAFFAELAPPQRMHCVRCHKDFVDVENDDRACLVPHDDESAEVERVGGAKRVPGAVGATFETLWGCCGKLVEGDGDQGPPDGWCYEGKHTTDIKRARFRADSTPNDDKLVSCLRLNCHGIRAQLPRGARLMRKRPRSINMKEATTDEDEGLSEGGSDSGMDEITGKTPAKRPRGRPPKKAKSAKSDGGERMDVDDDGASVAGGSVRGRGRPPKTKAQPGAASPPSAAKRRVRIEESKMVPGTDGEDDDGQSVKSTPAGPAKKRGRPPKSKAAAVPAAENAEVTMDVEDGQKKEKTTTKPKPRSPSRTRPEEAGEGCTVKPKSRVKKVREAKAKDAEGAEVEGAAEKPKKRRKVAKQDTEA
ncbi:uncharacterized protein BXZ73DRAFT_49103 [Epithele typhae]|uniref:uncharacterized protein n=1 Tax=Epithele typhae TaxID=378194 RepID=UPI0020079B05|nr:uncharacterized protein BXZ73DRAFT_49103 [Epithele typhae]KAH9927097.1 hypothetical protein BXZ73DRAFT_49103 [Epithele typhae]